jgi:hypothetical protein
MDVASYKLGRKVVYANCNEIDTGDVVTSSRSANAADTHAPPKRRSNSFSVNSFFLREQAIVFHS